MRWLALLGLIGCAGGGGGVGANNAEMCTIETLGRKAGVAMINSQRWTTSSGQWLVAGNGIQVILDENGAWAMTLMANTTDDGLTVVDALDRNQTPFLVSFTDAQGSAAVREDNVNRRFAYGTNQMGGFGEMWVESLVGNTLTACFDFTAATSAGEQVSIQAGTAKVDRG